MISRAGLGHVPTAVNPRKLENGIRAIGVGTPYTLLLRE